MKQAKPSSRISAKKWLLFCMALGVDLRPNGKIAAPRDVEEVVRVNIQSVKAAP
jgi:hypothetical protein